MIVAIRYFAPGAEEGVGNLVTVCNKVLRNTVGNLKRPLEVMECCIVQTWMSTDLLAITKSECTAFEYEAFECEAFGCDAGGYTESSGYISR